MIWSGGTPCSTLRFVYPERRANDASIRAVRELVVEYWSRQLPERGTEPGSNDLSADVGSDSERGPRKHPS